MKVSGTLISAFFLLCPVLANPKHPHPAPGPNPKCNKNGKGPAPIQLNIKGKEGGKLQIEVPANHGDQAASRRGGSACCPTVQEVIELSQGKNREGNLVNLYVDNGVKQQFYEISCAPGGNSDCVQQYNYGYALVNTPNGQSLDYIQLRSGCGC